MSSSRLLLVGGTVAIAAYAARRRKRTNRGRARMAPARPRLVVVCLELAAMQPALYGWDPGSFLSNIWGVFTGITAEVKQLILEAIAGAVDFVLGVVHDIEWAITHTIDVLTASYSWMAGEVRNVAGAVGGVVVKTYEMLDDTFGNFRDQLKSFLEHAWDDLKRWVTESIPDWLGGIFGDVWAVLKALAGIGMRGVEFLLNLIDDPLGFLWALLKDLVGDAINAALDAINLVGDGAEMIVRAGLAIIFAGYGDIIGILKKIWHILEYIADHVDDWTVDQLNLGISGGYGQIADAAVETVGANLSSIESLVGKLFGITTGTELAPIAGPQGPI